MHGELTVEEEVINILELMLFEMWLDRLLVRVAILARQRDIKRYGDNHARPQKQLSLSFQQSA